MKKTIYFTSSNREVRHFTAAISDVTTKRDIWISENKSKIGKIDSEDIKTVPTNANNSTIVLIIQLTYYTK